jgi:DNA-binding transcriptional regulator YiaG
MKHYQHEARPATARVVDQFEAVDLGAPFKVILHKAVTVTFDPKTGNAVKYSIPNLDGLLRTIVFTRTLEPRKLSGPDVKFVRKALGLKQKELAQRIEITAEHLSRCEAGQLVMSPTTEKLLRIFAVKTAIKLHKLKACEAKTKLESALDQLFDTLRPVAAFDVSDPLELHFHLRKPSSGSNDNEDDDGSSEGGDCDVQWDDEKSLADAA